MKVTVGISAYNEQNNIRYILHDLLKQQQHGWQLHEILVFSDGSVDQTVEKVASVKSAFIKVFDDKKRRGKTKRIEELFQKATGDIIVMFDADVRTDSANVITYLVKTFQTNQVMLVGGNSIPFKPKNFFQKAVYATFQVFYLSRIQIRNGSNLFACTGSCLAIKKTFAKKITFINIRNDDTYLYFVCKKMHYTFMFAKEAIVRYKLPSTLSDYLLQVFRSNAQAVESHFKKHFGTLVDGEYDRGGIQYYKNIMIVFFLAPVPTLYITFINVLCLPFFKFFSQPTKTIWTSPASTK